ncbi:MAG: tetratricopeptide repeat protein [Endomicrobiales bacterium]|nr:tetratricopeptide repeat protein [Endomicrobiales bacterium]
MMRKLLFTVPLCLLFFAVRLPAQDAKTLFTLGNSFYENGDYRKAAESYESIISRGVRSADVYFNLANSYYRTNNTGKAVVNYEKAALISPRDPEIRNNLEFLRALVNEPEIPFPENVPLFFNGLVSMNELSVFCSLVLTCLIICASAYLITRNRNLFYAGLILLLAAFLSGTAFALKIQYETAKRAVVISGPAEALNGPGKENTVAFTLPEGRKVRILGQNEQWAAVALPVEGYKGWMEKKNLEEF